MEYKIEEIILTITTFLFCLPLIPLIIDYKSPKPNFISSFVTSLLLVVQGAVFLYMQFYYTSTTQFICAIQWFILGILDINNTHTKHINRTREIEIARLAEFG